jgi:Concanavalin A-like lectin/glucanases superfamily/Domain of unknown function (DUF2341)
MRIKTLCCGLFAATCIIMAVDSCSSSPQIYSGDVVDTPNSEVSGVAMDTLGRPVANAIVRLRSAEYLAALPGETGTGNGSARETESGPSGAFFFGGIGTGPYLIEAANGNGLAVAVRCTVSTNDTAIALGADIVRRTGVVRGMISKAELGADVWFARIIGLERIVEVDTNTGVFAFNDIPGGELTVRLTQRGGANLSIDKIITVTPGDTTTVPFAAWKFSKRIFFNTTQSGAWISSTITDFPVLVRLTQNNFNFSESGAHGADVRFAKSNGTPLSFEIERWDSASGDAQLWVRVDTVFANDSSHFIQMSWGALPAEQATSLSSGAAVFDTLNGFVGVWHLSELSGDVADATVNADTGKNEGTVATGGAIGYGRVFDRNRISMGENSPLCILSDSITVSGWIKSTQVSDSTVSVIRHVGNFTALQFTTAHQWTSFWTIDSTGYSIVACPSWASTFGDGTWHYLTARFKAGQGCFVYMDGAILAQNTADTARLKTTTGPFYLGANEAGGEYYSGSLDEVRVERSFRSADWIKLCYMNQKSPDALLIFR